MAAFRVGTDLIYARVFFALLVPKPGFFLYTLHLTATLRTRVLGGYLFLRPPFACCLA